MNDEIAKAAEVVFGNGRRVSIIEPIAASLAPKSAKTVKLTPGLIARLKHKFRKHILIPLMINAINLFFDEETRKRLGILTIPFEDTFVNIETKPLKVNLQFVGRIIGFFDKIVDAYMKIAKPPINIEELMKANEVIKPKVEPIPEVTKIPEEAVKTTEVSEIELSGNEVERLRATNTRLIEENAKLETRNTELEAEVAGLKERISVMEKEHSAWQKLGQAVKKQADAIARSATGIGRLVGEANILQGPAVVDQSFQYVNEKPTPKKVSI
ncbi:MAG: hypothetical protein ACOXZS_01530 [Bacilli bacterium]|jgi:hypothetical protein